MGKINIILTVDYEIFGNGSGDVKRCLIEPTEKILKIADKYNIPITLMMEICEYWAFKKEEQKGNLHKEYRPATWIKNQIIRCIKTGHDIQLHIHPQWMNFSYCANKDKWNVDFNRWRVSSLSYEEIYRLLIKGKYELENLFRPYVSNYECIAFRAGAWSIQPEEHILKALINAGFKVDTTIATNCYFKNQLTYFDFRGTPKKPFWFVIKNLKKETTTGIIEIPIYTKKFSLFDKIYHKFLGKINKKNNVKIKPNNCNGFAEGLQKNESIIRKLLPAYRMLDFCVMSDNEMLMMIEEAERKLNKYTIIPIVAIGHSKSFSNIGNFESFIRKAINKNYKFATFKNIIAKII